MLIVIKSSVLELDSENLCRHSLFYYGTLVLPQDFHQNITVHVAPCKNDSRAAGNVEFNVLLLSIFY